MNVKREGVTADAYSSVSQQRATDRKRREQAEDRREDHKPKFIQPHKELQASNIPLYVDLLNSLLRLS